LAEVVATELGFDDVGDMRAFMAALTSIDLRSWEQIVEMCDRDLVAQDEIRSLKAQVIDAESQVQELHKRLDVADDEIRSLQDLVNIARDGITRFREAFEEM
jgi:archaellum component FlaC